MSLRFVGVFPSDEQFRGSGRSKSLPDGDAVREALRSYPVVPWALLVPSAEGFARRVGMHSLDITTLSKRAGETGVEGFYGAATGLPVIPHSGYVVDLSATVEQAEHADFVPNGGPIGSIRAADPAMQRAVAESLASNHTPQQLLGLAQAIIAEAMRAGS